MPQIAVARCRPRIGALIGLVIVLLAPASHAGQSLPHAAPAMPYGGDSADYANGQYVPSIFRNSDALRQAPVLPPDTARTAETAGPAGDYRDGLYIADKEYLLSYPRTLWRMASAPARFDRTDWLVAGGVAAAAGLFFAFDRDIRDFWQDHIRGSASENVSKVFDPFGDQWIGFGVVLGAYAVTETLDQAAVARLRREKSAALLTLESLAISNGIMFGVKFATGRERPNKESSPFDFDGPQNGTNTNTSFPSGHATSAFAIASTLSEIYGDDHPWVPWVLYPIATGTALTRIDRDKHWASDTFVGAALGYFVGKTVTRYNPFLEKHDMAVVPKADGGQYGLTLVHRF